MPNLSGITAVKIHDDTAYVKVSYAATVAVGDLVNTAYTLTDANESETLAEAFGVAITPGASGEPGLVAIEGTVTLVGATVADSETYIASNVGGKIKPINEQASGDFVTYVGTGGPSGTLRLNIEPTGLVTP